METDKVICPLCKSQQNYTKINFKDYRIVYCINCTVGFLTPFPTLAELKKYYGEEYFNGKHGENSGYKNYLLLKENLQYEAIKKLNLINKYIPTGNLLDLGAGTGIFLANAKNYNYEVYGNDISSFAVKFLKKQNIKTFEGPINQKNLPKNKFNIITAWDVFEHLPNIHEACTAIFDALLPDGYLFITTPYTNSLDSIIFQEKWYGYKKIPEHLFYFNKKSIKFLLEKSGFKIVNYKNWGFFRSIGFILTKLELYLPSLRMINKYLSRTNLWNWSLYLPFTDFLIIAQKSK